MEEQLKHARSVTGSEAKDPKMSNHKICGTKLEIERDCGIYNNWERKMIRDSINKIDSFKK